MSEKKMHTTELLAELIALPSVNKAFCPKEISGRCAGEERMAMFIENYFRDKNVFQFRRVLTKEGAPCALVKLPATEPNSECPTIAIFSHVDTVWVKYDDNPFTASIENGVARGLGSCDDKASICAAIRTLEELSDIKYRPFNFVFAATADEESGFTGIRTLVPEHIKPDFAIVAEPTSLNPIVAHKGVARYQVEVYGKSVHASLVPQGKNAIYYAAELILMAKKYLEEQLLCAMPHPLLGDRTLNIGIINGGSQPNAVPDKCVFTIERRFLPGESSKQELIILEKLFRNSTVDFKISETFYAAPFQANESQSFTSAFINTATKNIPGAKVSGLQCATEASDISIYGIPTIVFGPGDLAVAHSRDEFVKISDIENAVSTIVQFVKTYFNL